MCAQLAVAMSGGVDSSVAAFILREEQNALSGVTLQLFDAHPPSTAAEDARAVAEQLGFPHTVLDLTALFHTQVIAPFASAYQAGLTPNPCVFCNRRIKFGALLDWAIQQGHQGLATGHYVRTAYDSGSGRWLLKRALHPEKDQSYVLYSLRQDQLARCRFPLGARSKPEIRAIAQGQGMTSADKAESQDICFIPDGDYAAFLQRRTGADYPAGPFLDEGGAVLGTHQGIIRYTVGQRRGLGVSSTSGALYVKEIRGAENAVVLAPNEALFSRTLIGQGLNLIPCARLDAPVRLHAKVRYRQSEQPCLVEQTGEDTVHVTFDQPQRALAPGQAVVFYDGDTVVGGATIIKGE